MNIKFIFIGLFLVLMMFSGTFAKTVTTSRKNLSTKNIRNSINTRKKRCQKQCLKLRIEERHNCVQKCTNPFCFNIVFAEDPLESGERALTRKQLFRRCVEKLYKHAGYYLYDPAVNEILSEEEMTLPDSLWEPNKHAYPVPKEVQVYLDGMDMGSLRRLYETSASKKKRLQQELAQKERSEKTNQ
eukprot:TRINITY_DN897_c0_g1_i1.p1 TRINITY_DN897_c0_g1~~TRINITY_DN897_c0_g1_i1.p1  ORF type:complete len:186 (+),score=15.74 TRINITY_DN897_c0_g1_i1:47-604(+)